MLGLMPDYGHSLRFGSFVAPVVAPPHMAVDLAKASDDAGLDLVTFQDHPYQSTFHDAWTLMTWVAAQTSRIHLAGNVLNLPLRPPAVLARSVASLDLLSGGRVELGLGAGYFWDGIASMGGRRLTAGDGVDALSQAIDIIRGVWNSADDALLDAGGEFHSVTGVTRGPATTRAIPIWLGAYKQRMLRLVGTKADGWLPSLPVVQPGELERGNRMIDEAAVMAGRYPADITRLLNVAPTDSAEDLARLAIDDGFSVFILMTDDCRQISHFAEEVAPEIRERVTAARTVGGATPSGVAGVLSSGGPSGAPQQDHRG